MNLFKCTLFFLSLLIIWGCKNENTKNIIPDSIAGTWTPSDDEITWEGSTGAIITPFAMNITTPDNTLTIRTGVQEPQVITIAQYRYEIAEIVQRYGLVDILHSIRFKENGNVIFFYYDDNTIRSTDEGKISHYLSGNYIYFVVDKSDMENYFEQEIDFSLFPNAKETGNNKIALPIRYGYHNELILIFLEKNNMMLYLELLAHIDDNFTFLLNALLPAWEQANSIEIGLRFES